MLTNLPNVQIFVVAALILLGQSVHALSCNQGSAGGYHLTSSDGLPLTSLSLNRVNCEILQRMIEKTPQPQAIEKALQQSNQTSEQLIPFFNGEPSAQVGMQYWKQCQDSERKNHLTKNQNGYLVPECAPDTIYSWGNVEKINTLALLLRNNADWPKQFSQALFASHSAAATFGYGQMPLRIKVKPNVKYAFMESARTIDCKEMIAYGITTESEMQNTIFARYESRQYGLFQTVSWFEYFICSPQVIESWSFATQEHYDEILRDAKWMTNQKQDEWIGYAKFGQSNVFFDHSLDKGSLGTDFSKDSFMRSMHFLKVLTEQGFGGVSTPRDGAAKTMQHYQTKKPIYFNPE
jgi:hypothetical protein